MFADVPGSFVRLNNQTNGDSKKRKPEGAAAEVKSEWRLLFSNSFAYYHDAYKANLIIPCLDQFHQLFGKSSNMMILFLMFSEYCSIVQEEIDNVDKPK